MFFEMFAACALANVLTEGINRVSIPDYSSEFRGLNRKLDNLDSKLDKLSDTQEFMKARSCLEHFSPNLLEGLKLSYKYHTIQDIMEAAQEGFDRLCKQGCADEYCFKDAYRIFNETWGNPEWVNNRFGNEIDEWTEAIAQCEREYKTAKILVDEINENLTSLFYQVAQNPPVKVDFFGKKSIDEPRTKQLLAQLYNIGKPYPTISFELKEYITCNPDKKIEIRIDPSKETSHYEGRLRHFVESLLTEYNGFIKEPFFVNTVYSQYFENRKP